MQFEGKVVAITGAAGASARSSAGISVAKALP